MSKNKETKKSRIIARIRAELFICAQGSSLYTSNILSMVNALENEDIDQLGEYVKFMYELFSKVKQNHNAAYTQARLLMEMVKRFEKLKS